MVVVVVVVVLLLRDRRGERWAPRDGDLCVAADSCCFSSDPSSELASRPARAEPPRITLFDDQLSNVTWTYNTAKQNSASLGTGDWAAQYFEGTNFYIYIRGTDDPEGDWWHSHSDYKLTHRKGGVLVNSHFDSCGLFLSTPPSKAC